MVSAFVLVACGSREETIMICEFDDAYLPMIGLMNGSETITIEAAEDYVVMIEEFIRFELEEFLEVFGIQAENVPMLWDELASFSDVIGHLDREVYEAIDQITVELYDVTDTYVIVRIITRYDDMSDEELEIYLDNFQRFDFISLQLVVEGIEADGGVCEVQ